MREVKHEELSGNVFKMINSDWMLITAQDGDKVNTMTASWGGLGELWNKYVAFVFIRPQRYTFEFTEKTDRLTLSFFGGNQREALKICGSKSGRDCDKIAEAGLTLCHADGYPTFEEAEVVMECRKIYADDIKEDCMLAPEIMACYKARDFHRTYICEIEKILVKD